MMRLSSRLVAATSLYLRKKSLKSCTLHAQWTTSSSNVATKDHTMAVYHQQYCLVSFLTRGSKFRSQLILPVVSSIISTVGCSSHLGSTSQRSAVRIPFVSHRIRPGNMDREQHCMRIRQIRRAEAISCDCKFEGLAMAWLPPHDSEEELAEKSNTVGDRPNGTWIYYANSKRIYPYGWN